MVSSCLTLFFLLFGDSSSCAPFGYVRSKPIDWEWSLFQQQQQSVSQYVLEGGGGGHAEKQQKNNRPITVRRQSLCCLQK